MLADLIAERAGRRFPHIELRVDSMRIPGVLLDTLGAVRWAEQARTELRASGGTPKTTQAGPTRTLTPQELHVALTVAAGATNKETAAALFISAKTVEFHLGHIYRKLGLRSRSELVRYVSRDKGSALRPIDPL